MSKIPTAEELIFSELQENRPKSLFKYAYVVGKFPNGTAKVTFEGEDSASEKQYSYLASYQPEIGDRVILASTAGTYIILGKVKYNEAPEAPGSTVNEFDTLTTTGKATINSLEVTTNSDLKSSLIVRGNFQHSGLNIGFFGSQVTSRKSCSNLASNATLANVISKVNELLGYLRNYGLIV